MKLLILLLVILLQVRPLLAIEVLEERPNKPYSIISPISADAGSADKAFTKLKKKAESLGANAIIDWQCSAQEKLNSPFTFSIKSPSVCQGTAIKLK